MPDFELDADFKVSSINGSYLVECVVRDEDPDAPDPTRFRYFTRTTIDDVCALLRESLTIVDSVETDQLQKALKTKVKVEKPRD